MLTYPGNSYPTDTPRAQLYVSALTGFQGGVTNDDKQLYTGYEGVLP